MEQVAAYGMLDFKEPPKLPLSLLSIMPPPPPPRNTNIASKTLGRNRAESAKN
jgi:hypothetical protein